VASSQLAGSQRRGCLWRCAHQHPDALRSLIPSVWGPDSRLLRSWVATWHSRPGRFSASRP